MPGNKQRTCIDGVDLGHDPRDRRDPGDAFPGAGTGWWTVRCPGQGGAGWHTAGCIEPCPGEHRCASAPLALIESGAYATLFSRRLAEAQEEMRQNAELRTELGATRIALLRTMREVDDPVEMALTIARLTEVNRRIVTSRKS